MCINVYKNTSNTEGWGHTLTHTHTQKQITCASEQSTESIMKLTKLFSLLDKPNNSYDKINKFV